MKTTLSDRLKALGVKRGTGDLPSQTRPAYPIEQVVAGRFVNTAYGPIFVAETAYPGNYQRGCVALGLPASLHTMAQWAGDRRVDRLEPHRFIFLDTETTGLAGGTGTYAFLIGIGRYQDGYFHLVQLFLRDPLEEPALLTLLEDFLQPGEALVTFNGKSFDLPLLHTRYITNRVGSSLASAIHLDLLPLARRIWRNRLESRALADLEVHILGVTRDQQEVPGWLIPGLYFDYLRSGDARPLHCVFYHNAMDILALAELFKHLTGLLDDPLKGAEHPLDLVGIGKLYEDLGHLEMAAQLYQQGRASGLPEPVDDDILRRLSFVQRRRGDLATALELWHEAARRGQVYAHVELAKYYEHRQHDYQTALQWTRAAWDLVAGAAYPGVRRAQWLAEIKHRLARLHRKLSQSELGIIFSSKRSTVGRKRKTGAVG